MTRQQDREAAMALAKDMLASALGDEAVICIVVVDAKQTQLVCNLSPIGTAFLLQSTLMTLIRGEGETQNVPADVRKRDGDYDA